MNTTLELPLKPHLYKYLVKKLKLTSDVVDVSLVDIISFGSFVVNSLDHKRKFYTCCNKRMIDSSMSKCTKTIKINLGPLYQNFYGEFFTDEKVFYINRFLHRCFLNDLYTHIIIQKRFYPHIVVTIAVDDFFLLCRINEDEFSKNSIIRDFQRKEDEYSYLYSF